MTTKKALNKYLAALRRNPCRRCGAIAGSPCLRPSGHPVFGNGVHAGRFPKAGR